MSTEKLQEGHLWTPGYFMWILSDKGEEILQFVLSHSEIEGFFWICEVFVEIFLALVDFDVNFESNKLQEAFNWFIVRNMYVKKYQLN